MWLLEGGIRIHFSDVINKVLKFKSFRFLGRKQTDCWSPEPEDQYGWCYAITFGSYMTDPSLHQTEFWGFCSKECFDDRQFPQPENLMQTKLELNPDWCHLPAIEMVLPCIL